MKKRCLPVLLVLTLLSMNLKPAYAQVNEAAQLALNIQKLAELKSILTTLKKGFDVVSKGYNTVKKLTEGNFSLHKVFLDGLMQVSPTVKKYRKIPEIIEAQIMLIKETKVTTRRVLNAGLFNQGEVDYILGVYQTIVAGSLKNIDDLVTIITANSLRMTDDERLSAIDKICTDMGDKLEFVRDFSQTCSLLAFEKSKEKNQITASEKLLGLKNY